MSDPLANKRIVVTRPRAQAAELCNKLSVLGATPILFPTIEIVSIKDTTIINTAIRQLDTYDWIIFTSANGVSAFWEHVTSVEADLPQIALRADGVTGRPAPTSWSIGSNKPKIATIGPATAEAARQHGFRVDLIPTEYVAEAIVNQIGQVAGQRILIPRAETAREVLANELRARGAVVTEIAVYRTRPVVPEANELAELQRGVDAVTFTSSSTARNFVPFSKLIGSAIVACIGPITAQTAREHGFAAQVVAREYTTDGLLAALVEYYSPS